MSGQTLLSFSDPSSWVKSTYDARQVNLPMDIFEYFSPIITITASLHA